METNAPNRMTAAWLVTMVTFMELLDSSILNTSAPQIARSFGVDVLSLKTAITAYLISLSIFIPISGWMADRFGCKRIILIAVTVFTISSAFCGFSHTLPQLVAFRILQGVGGAMMTPVSRLIIIRLFKPDELLKVTGLVSIPIIFGPILGPVLGGYITTNFNWTWIFFLNVPIGIAAFLLMLRFVPSDRGERVPPFDTKGFLLVGISLAALSFAFENLDSLAISKGFLVLLTVGGMILFGASVLYCNIRKNAVLNFSLFGNNAFMVGVVMMVLGLVSTGGVQFLMPVMLQEQFGYSALQSGLTTFTMAVGAVLVRPFVAPMVRKAGYPFFLRAYPLAVAGGLMLFTTISTSMSQLSISLILLLFGVFYSIMANLCGTVPYLTLDRKLTSSATSLVSTVQQFSMSLGVSFGALLLDDFVAWKHVAIGDQAQAPGVMAAFHDCFFVMALVGVSAFFVACLYREAKTEPAEVCMASVEM